MTKLVKPILVTVVSYFEQRDDVSGWHAEGPDGTKYFLPVRSIMWGCAKDSQIELHSLDGTIGGRQCAGFYRLPVKCEAAAA